jgi:sigma-E factor negative regulatory protein RseA
MKPDISALLDDELEPGAASRTIDALRREKELQEAWNVYHLIGDALRRSPGYSRFAAKVMCTVGGGARIVRPTPAETHPIAFRAALAAAVTGMAAVGWVALLNAPQPLELATNRVHRTSRWFLQRSSRLPAP